MFVSDAVFCSSSLNCSSKVNTQFIFVEVQERSTTRFAINEFRNYIITFSCKYVFSSVTAVQSCIILLPVQCFGRDVGLVTFVDKQTVLSRILSPMSALVFSLTVLYEFQSQSCFKTVDQPDTYRDVTHKYEFLNIQINGFLVLLKRSGEATVNFTFFNSPFNPISQFFYFFQKFVLLL